MFYKCHNCSAGMSFAFFLKNNYPSFYDSYVVEKFKDQHEEKKTVDISASTKTNFSELKKRAKPNRKTIKPHLDSIQSLDDNHYAKRYVIDRQIPEEHYNKLFYTKDFAKLVKHLFPNYGRELYKDDPRLIIPFFNEEKKIIGMQGRSFDADPKLRYITIRDEDAEKFFYGLDRYDNKKTGYVVEGPIDSLFLPNCVATANSNLNHACSVIDEDLVVVYDNEPRNVEIVKSLETCIKSGRKVCIWNSNICEKDINDMILSGISQNDLVSIIESRTFSGLEAKLEFTQWKKI